MNNTTEEIIKIAVSDWMNEHKKLVNKIHKSYDFNQLLYDMVIISMVSITIKAILAMSAGQNIINLY